MVVGRPLDPAVQTEERSSLPGSVLSMVSLYGDYGNCHDLQSWLFISHWAIWACLCFREWRYDSEDPTALYKLTIVYSFAFFGHSDWMTPPYYSNSQAHIPFLHNYKHIQHCLQFSCTVFSRLVISYTPFSLFESSITARAKSNREQETDDCEGDGGRQTFPCVVPVDGLLNEHEGRGASECKHICVVTLWMESMIILVDTR